MKVIFYVKYPKTGASSRYRVYQYLDCLVALGVECHVQSFMDDSMYEISMSKGNNLVKFWRTIKAILHRLWSIKNWKKYDIIYMQREFLPFGYPFIERYIKNNGAITFFDYDDALFIKKINRYSPILNKFKSPNKIVDIFKNVSCVVAGNDWLRDCAIRYGCYAVTIEVAEDTNRIPMHKLHSNNESVTIGWLGSPSTVKYLYLIQEVLVKISKKYTNLVFEIIGGGDFYMEGVDWKIYNWSLEEELKALARFDIGLMPLPDEEWAKGKSGGKARTYMAAGVVPVCAAVGYNIELIDNSVTGYLCSNQQEWYEALCTVIEDSNLRQSIALSARREVEEKFSLEGQAKKMYDLFDGFVKQKAKNERL